jgi:hypothetical protein
MPGNDSAAAVQFDPLVQGGGRIALEAVDSAIVRRGIEYWRGLRGARRFPSRSDLSPRSFADLLRNTALLRVSEADYEYRIVGDAYVIAHGFSMQGLRWSDIDKFSPGYGAVLKPFYDGIVRDAEPFAMRGWTVRNQTRKQYVYSECVFLPLGADGEHVDHVLNFAVFSPRDGKRID